MPLYRVMSVAAGRQQVRRWRRAALHTVGLVALTIGICTVGLVLLDPSDRDWPLKTFDALWNAANMITTLGSFTGFNLAQRAFMLAAMFSVMLIGAYAITALTGILSSDAVLTYRENRRMDKVLATLAGHVVVVGYGPIGRRAAADLRSRGETVLVIDFDPAAAHAAAEAGFLTVLGAAARDEVHVKARVDRAKAMVITIDDPDRKLALTMMARAINPDLRIVATELDDGAGAWLTHAGASAVVVIDQLVAATLIRGLDGEGAAAAVAEKA